MPNVDSAADEMLMIRRQEHDLAQARHALTRRHVRDQEKLLIALRQSRMAAVARLEWAEDHSVIHVAADDVIERIDAALANARRRLESLRSHQEREEADLAAASRRLEEAQARIDRQGTQVPREGYNVFKREMEKERRGELRKAA